MGRRAAPRRPASTAPAMAAPARRPLQRLGADFGRRRAWSHAVDRGAPAGGDRPRAALRLPHPGDGRADHAAVHPRDRPPVRSSAGCATTASPSSTSATAWTRSTSSPTAVTVLRDGTLRRHARPRRALGRGQLVKHDGRPRPLRLLPQGAPRARAPATDGARGARPERRPARARTAASSCTRARCWAWPGWSAPAAPSWRA